MTTLFATNGGGWPAIRGETGGSREFSDQYAPAREVQDTRSRPAGYRLPHDVADRLKSALAGYKNRDAAMALAVFLARFWSSRAKMARPFPVDRRALADRDDLGLTEARIRGALRVLEEIGFLNRGLPPAGSVHRMTAAGELIRKPITFGFGTEFGPLFAAANARAERARLRRQGRAVQGNPAVPAARHPRPVRTAFPTISMPETSSPKDKERSGYVVLMGQLKGSARGEAAGRPAISTALDAALSRLGAAMRWEGLK